MKPGALFLMGKVGYGDGVNMPKLEGWKNIDPLLSYKTSSGPWNYNGIPIVLYLFALRKVVTSKCKPKPEPVKLCLVRELSTRAKHKRMKTHHPTSSPVPNTPAQEPLSPVASPPLVPSTPPSPVLLASYPSPLVSPNVPLDPPSPYFIDPLSRLPFGNPNLPSEVPNLPAEVPTLPFDELLVAPWDDPIWSRFLSASSPDLRVDSVTDSFTSANSPTCCNTSADSTDSSDYDSDNSAKSPLDSDNSSNPDDSSNASLDSCDSTNFSATFNDSSNSFGDLVGPSFQLGCHFVQVRYP